MRKKLVRILLVLIIAVFSIQLKVQAAVITSTDKEVESNSGNVSISVNSKQALGAYTLKISDTAGLELVGASGGEISADKKTITGSSATGTTSLGTYTFKVPTVTSDTTYRIKFSISGMETTSLEAIADESNTAVLTVTAPDTGNNSNTGSGSTTNNNTQTNNSTTTTTTKSSEARLKNFGINPADYDFSGFSKNPDKESWSVEVPNSVTSVEVYAEPKDSKAKVTGTGKVTLNEGNNTVKVTVTAEDGKTTKTYTLTIKRKTAEEEEAENGEARLKYLSINPEEYDFSGFESDKTEYVAEVPNEITEIEIVAIAMDSAAQITGTGIIELEEGKNELKIDVIAVNGTKKTYILEVTRKEAEETTVETFGLSTLSIEGLTLSPSFKVAIYEYTVTLEEDVSSLEIEAKANEESATVEIVGNENLQEGENVITILVKNEETEEVATYQIIVNKSLKEETIQASWLKPATWGKEEKFKIAIIIVLIILIICAIILKINIGKESKKAKKVDLPGAEELDKAIAEHQELSEEPNYTTENVEQSESQVDYTQNIEHNQVKQNYIEEIAKNRFGMEDNNFEEKPKRRGRHF